MDLSFELPDAVKRLLRPVAEREESVKRRLEAFGRAIADKRKEAIAHRRGCGIEDVWEVCRDAYIGRDEANQGAFGANKWVKPMTKDGPVVADQPGQSAHRRSTVFPPLTSRYVDAGAAKVSESIISPDDKSFSFSPTPIPDLAKGQDDLTPVESRSVPGMFLDRAATPEETRQMTGLAAGQAPEPQPETWPPRVPLTTKDLVEEAYRLAEEKAKKAERRIEDWLVECGYRKEARRVIRDMATYGVGVLKGPFASRVRGQSVSVLKGQNGAKDRIMYQLSERVQPAVRRIKPWDLYPDPACGENIHDGDYIFEVDRFSPKQVRALKKRKGYHQDLIDLVLAQGPQYATTDTYANKDIQQDERHRFEVWYFHGTITRDELELMNPEALVGIPEEQADVYAVVTLINDTAVYASVNMLDSGRFPYQAIPWLERDDYWAGIGVGEQMIAAQKIIKAAVRAMLNNAGAGTQIVVNRELVDPADKEWLLYAQKIWLAKQGTADVTKAFGAFTVPNDTAQMLKIIEFAFRLAEESTSIPLITQGQSGPTTPNTFGATQIQNNNANQLLRAIANNYDDFGTEPLIRSLYEWLMLDPDVPDDEKGDFQINAHGSSALVERVIQDQTIQGMSELVSKAAPVFGIDPKRWIEQVLRSKHLNPKDFQYSEEEQKKLEETPPPPPPQVQAALIRAEADAKNRQLDRDFDLQVARLDAQMEERRLQLDEALARIDTDRDTAYVQAETERTRNEHTARMKELEERFNLAVLDYSNRRGIAQDKVKADLAQTVMKLRTQKDLAGVRTPTAAPQVATPPTEPPGRAPNGQAFQK
jgi:hypothetical protein